MDDNYLRAIGRLTVAAGQIELDTFVLARLLIGGDFHFAPSIASSMQFEQMATLVKKLSSRRRPSDMTGTYLDCQDWLKEARDFMGERNSILHTTWIKDWPFESEQPANALHVKTMKPIRIPLADIEAIAHRGELLHDRFIPVKFRVGQTQPRSY